MAVDVAVIGAGASGLSCAAALAKNGATVVVFEADDRIGGRIRTSAATPLELGAQVVHGARNPLLALLGDAAVPDTRTESAHAVTGGRLVSMGDLARGGHPPWAVEERLTANPGPAAGTVASWLAFHIPADAPRLVAAEWFRQNWAGAPVDLAPVGIAAARRRDSVGAGAFTVAGGFTELPRRLAAGLDIRLGHAVRRVRWRAGQAELSISGPGGGQGTKEPVVKETARAVVVTAPPPVVAAGRLVIEDLPRVKLAAAHGLGLGDGCCLAVTLDHAAPQASVVFDADGRAGFVRSWAGRPDVLVVAKAGAAATVRAAAGSGGLATLLATALPWSAGARVTGTEVADWGASPWITGAFTFPRPGLGWAPGAWARPVAGTVFFAGEATWTSGPPSVHGAMASGERAAGEVLAALGTGLPNTDLPSTALPTTALPTTGATSSYPEVRA
mgnify:CR=1 FL=1